jgi:hypothetical protein
MSAGYVTSMGQERQLFTIFFVKFRKKDHLRGRDVEGDNNNMYLKWMDNEMWSESCGPAQVC